MTTIQKHRILGRVAIAAVLATCVAAPAFAAANGPAPTMNIVSPVAGSGTIFKSSFPASVDVEFTALMNEGDLKDLKNLNVKVNGVSLYGEPDGVNAFHATGHNPPECVSTYATTPYSCAVTNPQSATLKAPWSIPGVGTYTIVVSGKYQGATGTDTEVVEVAATISAEYPAPPAVANAYINAQGKGYVTAGQRGCIIGKIAKDAQMDVFGARPGPYDTDLIEGYVLAYMPGCPR